MITLTEKDADFVASLAREEIKGYEKAFEKAKNKLDKIFDCAKKLCASCPSEENLEGFNSIEEEYQKSITEISSHFQEKIKEQTRVIELMLGGSDER